MKKIIFILLLTMSAISIALAQENVAANDSSQVEFYSSMEDFLNRNIIPPVHITILAVTDVYRIFGITTDFKVEIFPNKKEKENYFEKISSLIL